jgi:hypothetical protein
MPEPHSRYQAGFCLVEVDAGGLPVAQLGGVGAALVAARDEGRLAAGQLLQRFEDVLARRLGRVGLGADHDEVVVHDFLALDAESLRR